MPWIEEERRNLYNAEIQVLMGAISRQYGKIDLPLGDLTYIYYKLGMEIIKMKGRSYENITTTLTSLRDAHDDLRRKVKDPYEDLKEKESGSIL